MQGTIIDYLMPPLSEGELMVAMIGAACSRAVLVGFALAGAMALWPGVSLAMAHPWAVLWFGLNGAMLLSFVGLLSSIWADKFDHNAAITNFVVQPLSLLSGTFYVIDNLSPAFQAVSRMNPFFYVISGFRYGFLGRSDLGSTNAAVLHGALALGAERHVVLPLDLRQFGGSALTDDIAVPKEGVGADIPVTYVPARNLVFLSLTLAWAEALGSRDIFIGVNALDYSGYPDCRPEFIAAFADLAELATKAGAEGGSFAIHAPLQYLGKADIAREAHRLGLDAGMSWSCYDPQPDGSACGLCDSCRLRLAGFAEAGLEDPLAYATRG
jgi:7-cyano-7-deazaguanine synthase